MKSGTVLGSEIIRVSRDASADLLQSRSDRDGDDVTSVYQGLGNTLYAFRIVSLRCSDIQSPCARSDMCYPWMYACQYYVGDIMEVVTELCLHVVANESYYNANSCETLTSCLLKAVYTSQRFVRSYIIMYEY